MKEETLDLLLKQSLTKPSEQALNELGSHWDRTANCFINETAEFDIIEKDLDRLSELEEKVAKLSARLKQYDQALNEIASKKPASPVSMNHMISDEMDINGYIHAITEYILELSSTDNIIISAVYERLKHDSE